MALIKEVLRDLPITGTETTGFAVKDGSDILERYRLKRAAIERSFISPNPANARAVQSKGSVLVDHPNGVLL